MSTNILKTKLDSTYTQIFILILILLDLAFYVLNETENLIIQSKLIKSITTIILGIYSLEILLKISHNKDSFAISNVNVNINDNDNDNDEKFDMIINASISEKESLLNNDNINISIIRPEVSTEFDQFAYILMGCVCITFSLGMIVLSWSAMLVTTFAMFTCLISFWYCSRNIRWIMSSFRGTSEMQMIADYIKEGADSYLKTQYKYIGCIAIGVAFILMIIYLFRGNLSQQISPIILSIITSISFLIGSFCSALAGYTGVWISVRCNLRVAAAASKYDYPSSFLLAFRGGAASAIISASMCILGITTLYIIDTSIFVGYMDINESEIPLLLGGYGFGASFVALFMQLGGGIYTKAADVGADMVGKIEIGIPEDDARNAAVIADLVGDNVGDCAGSMADVFESIAAEMIGTMILGATLTQKCQLQTQTIQLYIFFPIIIHSLDLIVSMIGISCSLPKKNQDAIVPMKRGYTVSLILAIILYLFTCRIMLYTDIAPSAWWHYGLCGFVGLFSAYFIVLITQYYTDYNNEPVHKIAIASRTGHGTNIIAGISVGMESTALPSIVISISLFVSFMLGYTSGLPQQHLAGLFGTACGTMGVLCTAVFILSMNNFGPIADNAGGIIEMSHQSHDVRIITDRLDAVGNVTKAVTKGYAVCGSALSCFLLFNAFLDEISILADIEFKSIDLTKIEVMISGILGIMMVFLFTAWSIDAVGRTAQEVVKEVRRQFHEIDGIMDGITKPEYRKCVEIVTRSALKEMIRPAVLALATPIIVGLIFKYIGKYLTHETMLGVEALASFLMFATISGLLMAVFLDNSGGAWDNAKKLIESKNLKHTEVHAAAVTGDTVGDPFKDTAGPALHVVITTMSTTALVLGPLFVANIQ